MPLSGRVAIIAPPRFTRTTNVSRPPNRSPRGPAGAGNTDIAGDPLRNAHPKLLNMRDFQARSGFPPVAERRYNSVAVTGNNRRLGPISSGTAFRDNTRHWLGKV